MNRRAERLLYSAIAAILWLYPVEPLPSAGAAAQFITQVVALVFSAYVIELAVANGTELGNAIETPARKRRPDRAKSGSVPRES